MVVSIFVQVLFLYVLTSLTILDNENFFLSFGILKGIPSLRKMQMNAPNGWGSVAQGEFTQGQDIPHQNRFHHWKAQQSAEVTLRGYSEDIKEEENYIKHMIRLVMRSHFCHKQVDQYAECLLDNKLVTEEELDSADVSMQAAQVKCPKQIEKLVTCMDKTSHHAELVDTVVRHQKCDFIHRDFLRCVDTKPETALERDCIRPYFSLLRCGLNHTWDDYWRTVGGFDQIDDVIMYDVERQGESKKALNDMAERRRTVSAGQGFLPDLSLGEGGGKPSRRPL